MNRRVTQALWAFALATSLSVAQSAPRFPDRVCDVVKAGAQGTRIWPDTAAFQQAIDECARAGGGTVSVPRGEYLIGPIYLKSNIRLELKRGAELAAATEESLYQVTPDTQAYATNGKWTALINIADAQNVALVGEGLIDGQGAVWWEKWRAAARAANKSGPTNRPRLVHAARSRDLLFQGITLLNSPSFHLVVKGSERVTIERVTIRAPAHSPNTDAIDPVDSRDVLIANNVLDVGDDVVAIKSLAADPEHPNAAAANIIVRNNTCLAGRGISIGSETVGGVRNVLVEGNTIKGAMYGIRIKSPRGKGGEVSDIVFRDNTMEDVATPIVFSGYYQSKPLDEGEVRRVVASGGFLLNNQIYPAKSDPAQPYVPGTTPYIHDVLVTGLTAVRANRAGVIVGLPEKSIERVRLENVRIEADSGLLVRHAQVVTARSEIKVKSGESVISEP